MLDTKILIGDVVELSPAKYSTIDDFDLEKCTVLKMDDENKRIMVVFNKDNEYVETFFDNNSTVDWFSERHVTDIERDYKVTEVIDTQDTKTNQQATLIKMARMNKEVQRTIDGVTILGNFDENDIEYFLFVGFKQETLSDYIGTVNRISFANYRARNVVIEGEEVRVWQPRYNMTDTMNIFSKVDVA